MTDATRKVLPVLSLGQAEYTAPRFHVRVDDDVTMDDIMRPAFWAHHAGKLRPFNTIEVVRQNLSLDVELRVIEVGTGFVVVRPLRIWEDEAIAQARAAAVESANTVGADTILPTEYKITTARGNHVLTYTPTDTKLGSSYKTHALAVAAAREHAVKAGIAWPDPSTAPVTEEA